MEATLTIIDGFSHSELTSSVRYYLMAMLTCPLLAKYVYTEDELKKISGHIIYCDLKERRKAVLEHHLKMGFVLTEERIKESKINTRTCEYILQCP